MKKATAVAVAEVKQGWVPTRKWLAAEVTALGGLAAMLLTGDTSISDSETVAIITFAVQALATYLLPNAAAPGGVPDAEFVPAVAKVESGSSHTRRA